LPLNEAFGCNGNAVECVAYLDEVLATGLRDDEALVLAILFGAVLRAVWTPVLGFQAGIAFSAKQLLELAVMLLGASLDLTLVTKSGLALLVVIVAVVLASLGASYGVSRALGLPNKLAILVACGNSICGNSAMVISSESLNTTARNTAFSSWRTLPGQSKLMISAMASASVICPWATSSSASESSLVSRTDSDSVASQ